jgi:predicted nucleic acid-binding protein
VHLVDASVWAAMVDPRDRYHSDALAFLGDFSHSVAVMDLTLYEIANAVGVKRGETDGAHSLVELAVARSQGRVLDVDAELTGAALSVAAEHGLTAYDAAYVAAARRNGMTLVSTDVADLVSKGLAVTPDAALYP